MLGKIRTDLQQNLFKIRLTELINIVHPLVKLAHKISWDKMEQEFEKLFSESGRPSIVIRKITGMLLLKEMFKERDETVGERWVENSYWQYFTGETFFRPSSLLIRVILYTSERELEKRVWNFFWDKAFSFIQSQNRK